MEFYNAGDAAEAHDKLDHAKLAGREIAIVFAKDKRKTPGEMRGGRDMGPRGGGGGESPEILIENIIISLAISFSSHFIPLMFLYGRSGGRRGRWVRFCH